MVFEGVSPWNCVILGIGNSFTSCNFFSNQGVVVVLVLWKPRFASHHYDHQDNQLEEGLTQDVLEHFLGHDVLATLVGLSLE